MKTLLAGSVAAAAVFAIPAAMLATGHADTLPMKCTATFTGHPENSNPVWALDDFTRTTTFKALPKDKWAVHIHDAGHFTTIPGTKSDSGDVVKNKVTGTFQGGGDYTVTSKTPPKCILTESYTGTGGPSTGKWPAHYFGETATSTGIDPWHWDYATACEKMSEDSVTHTSGHMAGKTCPSPSPSPRPTPSSPSPEPSESTPAAPAPTPVESDLPVTG